MFDLNSTKTIGFLALDFHQMIVDSGFALIKYQLIKKFRPRNLIVNNNNSFYESNELSQCTKLLQI